MAGKGGYSSANESTIVIPLKLFLKRNGFPADNISSRVAWKFRVGVSMSGERELR